MSVVTGSPVQELPPFWQGPPVLLMSFLCHTTVLQVLMMVLFDAMILYSTCLCSLDFQSSHTLEHFFDLSLEEEMY